jgi:hypothetical protein
MPEDSRFSSNEAETLVEYEPIDRLALAVLLLGIASIFALIHPLLWALPILAIALAAFALRRIAIQQRQSGRRSALWGLGLALLFGSCAFTWTLTANYLMSSQARKCCDTWLALLRDGELYKAHQLTMRFEERLSTDDSLDKFYTSVKAGQIPEKMRASKDPPPEDVAEDIEAQMMLAYDAWSKMPPISTLTKAGSSMRFQFDRSLGSSFDSPTEYHTRYVYSISYEEDGHTRTMPVEIWLNRTVSDGVGHWRISTSKLYNE